MTALWPFYNLATSTNEHTFYNYPFSLSSNLKTRPMMVCYELKPKYIFHIISKIKKKEKKCRLTKQIKILEDINNVIQNSPKTHLHHQTSLDATNDGSYPLYNIP